MQSVIVCLLRIKLISYPSHITHSQSNHINQPYSSNVNININLKEVDEERCKSTHKTIESSGKKSRIHKSLVFTNNDSSYKFYITYGNNHPIVERIMRKRDKFNITSEGSINFTQPTLWLISNGLKHPIRLNSLTFIQSAGSSR